MAVCVCVCLFVCLSSFVGMLKYSCENKCLHAWVWVCSFVDMLKSCENVCVYVCVCSFVGMLKYSCENKLLFWCVCVCSFLGMLKYSCENKCVCVNTCCSHILINDHSLHPRKNVPKLSLNKDKCPIHILWPGHLFYHYQH